MLKIKLARFGKRNQPTYRIVINQARTKRDGKYIEKIGFYAPTYNPKVLKIDTKAYENWIQKGAQPTETVASLFKRYQSDNPFPTKKKKQSKKQKARQQKESKEKEASKKQKENEKK